MKNDIVKLTKRACKYIKNGNFVVGKLMAQRVIDSLRHIGSKLLLLDSRDKIRKCWVYASKVIKALKNPVRVQRKLL